MTSTWALIFSSLAQAMRDTGKPGVENLTASAVKEDVDSVWAYPGDAGLDVLALVVDRLHSELVAQPRALALPACDTHDTTALELGDLADDRSDGSGRGGNEHRVAGLRLPNIEQPAT